MSDWCNGPAGVGQSLNAYLHYAFDLWADQWRRKHAKGQVIAVRYADDIAMGFKHKREAKWFMAEMQQRLEKFALSLHPERHG